MSSPPRDQTLTRERALSELVHIVSVRPHLGMRALMAAMKGRRAQVTAEQLTDLLASGRFRASGAGWVLVQVPDQLGEQPAPRPNVTARGLAEVTALPTSASTWLQPQPAAISWDPAELADVLDATPEELGHAVWVLAQNEDTAPRWLKNLQGLHRRQPLRLTSEDLKEVRGQLNAMVRERQAAGTSSLANASESGDPIDSKVVNAPSSPQPVPAAGRIQGTQPISHGSAAAKVHAPRWEDGAGGCKIYRCAPAATFGEERLAQELARLPHGLAIMSPVLALRGEDREVDAIVVTPHGVVVIEQKDVHRGSEILKIGPNSAPEVDGQVIDSLSGAWRQARLHAQKLATLLKNETTPAVEPGFINAVLSFEGVGEVDARHSQVWPTTTRSVRETVDACLSQRTLALSAPEVARMLAVLGTRDLAVAELAAAGFSEQ